MVGENMATQNENSSLKLDQQ